MTIFKDLQKKCKSKKALSLTELIVATVLTGIIMLGMASFEMSFRSLTKTDNLDSLRSQMSYFVHMFRNDAAKAVGDPSNPGIVWNTETIAGNYRQNICFRHDVSDPTSYDDDIWACFSSGSSGHAYRCTRTDHLNLRALGETSCRKSDWGDPDLIEEADLGGSLLKNTPFFTVVTDANGNVESVKFHATTSPDTTIACHPDTNPCYSIESEFYPYGVSSF